MLKLSILIPTKWKLFDVFDAFMQGGSQKLFRHVHTKGASINYVGKILPIFDPPPSVGKFTT